MDSILPLTPHKPSKMNDYELLTYRGIYQFLDFFCVFLVFFKDFLTGKSSSRNRRACTVKHQPARRYPITLAVMSSVPSQVPTKEILQSDPRNFWSRGYREAPRFLLGPSPGGKEGAPTGRRGSPEGQQPDVMWPARGPAIYLHQSGRLNLI